MRNGIREGAVLSRLLLPHSPGVLDHTTSALVEGGAPMKKLTFTVMFAEEFPHEMSDKECRDLVVKSLQELYDGDGDSIMGGNFLVLRVAQRHEQFWKEWEATIALDKKRASDDSPSKMRYAHFTHIDGEAGICDYESVCESRDSFQLTYRWLRETHNGENVGELRDDGCWYVANDTRPYSDVCFTDEYPASVVG